MQTHTTTHFSGATVRRTLTADHFEQMQVKTYMNDRIKPVLDTIQKDQKLPDNHRHFKDANEDWDVISLQNAIREDSKATELVKNEFERQLLDVTKLRQRVVADIEKLEGEAQGQEDQYVRKLGELARCSDEVFDKFKSVQDKMIHARGSASHISDRLQSQEQSRKRAGHALDLIEHIMQFSKGSAGMDVGIFQGPPDEASAKAISDLMKLRGDLSVASGEPTSAGNQNLASAIQFIEKKFISLQKQMFEEFDVAYKNHKQEKLKEYAKIMVTYFNEEECIEHYLKTNCSLFKDDKGYSTSSPLVRHAVDDPAGAFTELTLHLLRGASSIENEYQMIKRIFPRPEHVMKRLAEKVYDSKISQFLAAVREATTRERPLMWLEAFYHAYNSVILLEDELMQYDLGDLDLHTLTMDLFPELKPSGGDRNTYIQMEMQSLQDTFEDLKTTAAVNANEDYKTLNSGLSPPEEDDTAAIAMTLSSTEIASKMFEMQIDATTNALQRAYKLSTEDDRQQNSQRIVDFLITQMKTYLNKGLAKARQQIPSGDQKSAKDFKYFNVVTNVSRVVKHLKDPLCSYVYNNFAQWHSLREEVLDTIAAFIHELERDLQDGLRTALEGMTRRIKNILDQNKSRWKNILLGNDEDVDEGECSAPMRAVRNAISEQYTFIVDATEGKSKMLYLRAYGSRLYAVFIEYFAQFKVSMDSLDGRPMAGDILKKDLQELKKTVKQFNVPIITAKFEILEDIGQIFNFEAEKVYLVFAADAFPNLQELDEKVKLEYIKRRSDYESRNIPHLLKAAGVSLSF